MKSLKRNYLYGIVLFSLIIGLFSTGIYFLFKKRKIEEVRINYKLTKITELALPRIKHRYDYGDIENTNINGTFSCGNLIKNNPQVDHFYFRCNPDYLECFFEKGTLLKETDFVVSYEEKKYKVFVKRNFPDKKFYKSFNLNGRSGIILELGVRGFSHFSFFIFLDSSCNELYLPQRAYGYGPFEKGENFVFDNIGEDIFIDKFLVSLRDIINWVKDYKPKISETLSKFLDEVKQNPEKFAHPAYNLTKEEMNNYCHDQGKEILTAHFYDAASFYPLEKKHYDITHLARSAYPFQKYENVVFRENFLLMNESEQVKFLENLKEEHCEKIYSKECVNKFPYKLFNSSGVSHIGMAQTLGFMMEYTPNVIETSKNLNLSSDYFPLKSFVHKLGVRGFWDGEGSDKRHFEFSKEAEEEINEVQNFKVGFRCMRKYSNKERKFRSQENSQILEFKKMPDDVNFGHYYYGMFLASDYVEILNRNLFNSDQKILPHNMWVPLLNISSLSSYLTNGISSYCLYYKFPSIDGKDLGAFKVVPSENNKCSNRTFLISDADVTNIVNAKFSFDEGKSEFEIDAKFLKEVNEKYLFKFSNVVLDLNPSEVELKEKFRPHLYKIKNAFDGITVLGVNLNLQDINTKLNQDEKLINKMTSSPCGGKEQIPCSKGRLWPEGEDLFCSDDLKIYLMGEGKKVCL